MEHKEQENENILEKKKKERREIEKEKEKTTWTKVSDLGNYMELHPSSHTGYTGDTGGTDVDVL